MAAKQSGTLNIPLMILAFLAMAGFLYWLNITSEPTQIAVAEENELDAMLAEATTLSPVALGEDIADYEGELIRVPNIAVTELLGGRAFWFEVATGEDEAQPIFVSFHSQFIDAEFQAMSGDVMTLIGNIRAMSDQVIEAMEGQGVFTEEGQRAQVEAMDYYVEAVHMEIHTAAAEPDDEDDPTDDEETEGEEEG